VGVGIGIKVGLGLDTGAGLPVPGCSEYAGERFGPAGGDGVWLGSSRATGVGMEEGRAPDATASPESWINAAMTFEGWAFDDVRLSALPPKLGLVGAVLTAGVGADGRSAEALGELDP
jgi:hypothetical protein